MISGTFQAPDLRVLCSECDFKRFTIVVNTTFRQGSKPAETPAG
jgi:hypothetical protein